MSTDARICQPQSCPFFIQKVTKTAKGQGRTRTLNSCLGRLKITQKQANRLGIEPYSRRSPLLEKCCFLLSASESYQNASIDLGTLTGVKVSHSSQHRRVQRQEFSAPEASQALAQLSIDGRKVRLRTEKGLPCEWRDYKAVPLQDFYYGAFFQDNLSLTDWVNSQPLANPVICLGDGHDGAHEFIQGNCYNFTTAGNLRLVSSKRKSL